MKLIKVFLGLLLVMAVLAAGLPFGGQPAAADDGWGVIIQPFDPLVKGNAKLDSGLNRIISARSEQAGAMAPDQMSDGYGETVRVVVECGPGKLEAVWAAVGSGATVETSYGDLLQVSVPVGDLTALAAMSDVRRVRLPQRPVTFAVTSEGVGLANADRWQAAGYNGTGVKIGILDVGFTGYAAKLGTELPASVTAQSFDVTSGISGTTSHGTACAEIVYDMAPGAQFFLTNFSTDVEMGNAVNWLINTAQVDIISCSCGYNIISPGDGTGSICNMVTSARSAGILWCQAAGNSARSHWSGAFSSPDSDSLHNFSGTDETNPFYASTGSSTRVEMKWDDTYGASSNDYDLYLFFDIDSDDVLESNEIVAYSTDEQSGSSDPVEAFSYTAEYTGWYYIVIDKYSGTAKNIHLYSYQNLYYKVASSSLCVPADSPNALTVGAVPWNSPTIIESFSSQGPTKDARTKPDLSASDNVSNTVYSPFTGTSAATPHVAGAAALVKQYYPSYTPAQLQAYLEARAVDLGTAGKDNVFGSGRLNLDYSLTMAVSGNGTVTPSAGAHFYVPGDTVNIIATPGSGWHFSNWTGDVSTVANVLSANTTVTMNGSYTITANFTRPVLTMAASGNGTTTPSAGTHVYDLGMVVSINATAATNWSFTSWTGDVSDNVSASTNVTMDDDKTVTANFLRTHGTVTLVVSGNGTVALSPVAGNNTYTLGSSVNMTATPDSGWRFSGWSGDVGTVADVQAASTNLTVSDDYTITATFTRPVLTMAASGSGTVTPSAGAHEYDLGTLVSINATAASGWRFYKWIGDVDNIYTYSTNVTMDDDETVTAVFYQHPALEWSQPFLHDVTDTELYEVIQTADGGYAFTGYKQGGLGDNDVWVVKTDASGNLTWEKYYGSTTYDHGKSIYQTSDGGYIVSGFQSVGSTTYQLILKTDATGNLTWSRTFENGTLQSVCQTTDGGYIAVGHVYNDGPGPDRDAYLVKLDASGNTTWEQNFDVNTFNQETGTVVQTADGGYAVFGYIDAGGLFIKTNSSGNLTFSQTYAGYEVKSGQQTSDGGYIITGDTSTSPRDACLIKTDASGNITWSKTFGGLSDDRAECVVQTFDGGYALSGFTESYAISEYSAAWVIKTDSSGVLKWHYTFETSFHNINVGSYLRQCSDGGFIIGGNSDTDIFLLKLDGSTLNMAVSGSGTTTPSAGVHGYDWKSSVNITASAASGWQFSSWTGNVTTVGNVNSASTNITMNGDYTITAVFTQVPSTSSESSTPVGGGGGGGGGGAAATDDMRVAYLVGLYNEAGQLMESVEALSLDIMLSLPIPRGTVAKNRNGVTLPTVNIITMAEPEAPPAGHTYIGRVYDLGPSGATFDPPLTMTLKYDASTIPAGLSEEDFYLATWDETALAWSPIEYRLDTENDLFTIEIAHFSQYAILVDTRSAAFTLSDLTVDPAQIVSGETTTVRVIVANTGNLTGEYLAALKVNGATQETQSITLEPDAQAAVSFELTGGEPGLCNIYVGDLQAELTVTGTPAAFEVENLLVTPAEADPGQTVSISVAVTNTGQTGGEYSVTLNINGTEAETKEITLAGGETRQVEFEVTSDKPGRQTVEVNGLQGGFTVSGGEPPQTPLPATSPPVVASPVPEPGPEATGEEASPRSNTVVIIAPVCGACLVAALGIVYIRRRHRN